MLGAFRCGDDEKRRPIGRFLLEYRRFAQHGPRTFSAGPFREKRLTPMGFLSKLLTVGEGKQLKRYQAIVDKINGLEPQI